MKIWHQSFTELDVLPAYREAMESHIRKVVNPGTEVVMHGVRSGTYTTNYPGNDLQFAALFALHGTQWITQGLKAQDEGFDAFAMCTLPNPFIREVRSLLDIPVVGYGEANMHMACMLGHRFGLMIFIDRMVPLYYEQMEVYGVRSRCAGVRPVGFTFNEVLKAWNDPTELIGRFEKSAAQLIDQGADVLIPGEMPLNVLLATNAVRRVQGVPIMDGLAVTLKMAEMQASLRQSIGLSQSRRGWMNEQPDRKRTDEVLAFYGLGR